jgi:hypothetical protein
MRQMMLDVVIRAAKALAGKFLCEQLGERIAPAPVCEAITHQAHMRDRRDEIADLAQAVGATVLIDGDMIDVGEGEPRLAQAIGDGLGGESRPMLDAPEALLFRRRDQCPVAHERRRGISVECIEPEDDHCARARPAFPKFES